MKIKLFLTSIMFLVTLNLLHPSSVFGADFTFDYDIYYDVQESGMTRVRHEITLTNEVTDYYARNYTLTVFSTGLKNVAVSDPGGRITPIVTENEGQTTLTIPFNVQVVGRGRKLPFTIFFDSLDIAEKKGRIWEIIIPGIERTEEIGSLTIHLSVPPAFGKAAYTTPLPNDQGVWTLTELNDGGLTAGFGDYQVFAFNLEYFLENLSGKRELQEITLPADTPYQKITLTGLTPPPQNVRVDRDGNWLAEYVLETEEKQEIVAKGSAKIFLTPQGVPLPLTIEERQLYTREQPFWEQTAEVKQKANELKNARAIYDWVIKTLSYDYNRVEQGIKRLGTKVALNNVDRAACMEFSDLFIATARAAGIPAREIHGFAYTTNSRLQPLSLVSDVLHAWPEYYDEAKQNWIPVDPTWADTTHGVDYFSKLDFNHFAFAILGEKSDFPYPAGSFKSKNSGKDVFVNFETEELMPQEPQYKIRVEAKNLISGIIRKANLVVENTGQVNIPSSKVTLAGPIKTNIPDNLFTLPPYAKAEVPLKLKVPFSPWSKTYPLEIKFNSKTTSQDISFYPFYMVIPGQIGLFGLAIAIATAFIIRRRAKH